MGAERDDITGSPAPGELSRRDRALLRAVADGHGEVADDCGPVLTIDGRCCCDQLAARRLTQAGLIERPSGTEPRPARLTPTGHLLLLV
jgi:hypothetical protein